MDVKLSFHYMKTSSFAGLNFSCSISSLSAKAVPLKFNIKKELTGDYIAGLTQADGSFSVVLRRTKRKTKDYLSLSPVFTLVQNEKFKDLILEIQKK